MSKSFTFQTRIVMLCKHLALFIYVNALAALVFLAMVFPWGEELVFTLTNVGIWLSTTIGALLFTIVPFVMAGWIIKFRLKNASYPHYMIGGICCAAPLFFPLWMTDNWGIKLLGIGYLAMGAAGGRLYHYLEKRFIHLSPKE